MYRYIIPMWHARLDAELRAERRADEAEMIGQLSDDQ